MENYLLLRKNKELEELSKQLGFDRTYFLDEDLVLVKSNNKKEIINQIKKVRSGKLSVFIAGDEEILRFVLEKTSINIILGAEKINYQDSVHFLRSGLDQVLCKIAAEKGKVIGFSFSNLLEGNTTLLARMHFNIKLCKKYNVKIIFNNFSNKKEEIRSAQDLRVFSKLLSINNN